MKKSLKLKKTDKILRATHGSPEKKLELCERKIQCYVLEDGMAVLSGRGMQEALGLGQSHGAKFAQLLSNKSLIPFIDNELTTVINNPIRFIRPGRGGAIAKGYEATTLTKICRSILDARRSGAFAGNPVMLTIASECEILVSAFSDVGIVALVYEITGYEKDKARDVYQKYVEKFIRKEYAAWVRRFPIKFFELMCDLKGWKYEKNKTKYYPSMGHIINDVVYKRLAPNILEELKKVNPIENGKRKVKQHQWLTEDIGIPSLAEHLIGVMTLATANSTWRRFHDQLERVFPPYNSKQLYLNLDFQEENIEE